MPRFPLRKPSGPGRFRVATLLGVVSLGCSAVDELSSMAVCNLADGIAVSETKTSFRGAEGSAQGFRLGLRRGASQGEELVMGCLGIAPSFRAVVSADSDFPANPPPRLGEILKRSPRANPFGIGYCSRCIAERRRVPRHLPKSAEMAYFPTGTWSSEGYQRDTSGNLVSGFLLNSPLKSVDDAVPSFPASKRTTTRSL